MKFSNPLKVLLVAVGLVSANAYADANTSRSIIAARCSGVYAAVAGFASQTKDVAVFNDARRKGTLYLDAAYVYIPQEQANSIAKNTADAMSQRIISGNTDVVIKAMRDCDAWARTQGN